MRILTPGSSARCRASGRGGDRPPVRRAAHRARRLRGRELAGAGVRGRAAGRRAARLRAGERPPLARGGPGRSALGAAERLAREGRRPDADAAAGDAAEPADRARGRRGRPHPRRVVRATRTSASLPGHAGRRARTARRRRRWPPRRRTASASSAYGRARGRSTSRSRPSRDEDRITCDASGDAIAKAVQSGAAVINMSYGSLSRCAPEWVQIYFAVAKGIIPVAAAGQRVRRVATRSSSRRRCRTWSPSRRPTPDDTSARFSNANAAIDLSAPGVGILTAVPPALDSDGARTATRRSTGRASPRRWSPPRWRGSAPRGRSSRPTSVVQAVRLTARATSQRPGWDPLTGFGVLNIGAALAVDAKRLPTPDPLEPNDNLAWVDGTRLRPRPAAVWSGGRQARERARWTSRRTRSTSTGS